MILDRRRFLVAGGIAGAGAYINYRGLRFPRLGFEPSPLANYRKHPDAEVRVENLIFLPLEQAGEVNLRAYSPNARIRVRPHTRQLLVTANNINEHASLLVDGDTAAAVSEEIDGITRKVLILDADGGEVTLTWALPTSAPVSFAVIGDTGGGDELDWCIHRARQLGAAFILHLGDFNYGGDEYQSAITKFHSAPLPVYVSIGNHDFNDNGLVYQNFRDWVGPMNNAFTLAGTRFINFDTAATFLPPYAGNRGRLGAQLRSVGTDFSDQLVFTHRPFMDTRPGRDHNLSGLGEIDWLHTTMNELGASNLVCGHVHRSTEIDFKGITQYTSGEGLGYEDFRHKQQTARILIGTAEQDKKLEFEWKPLLMPWKFHTSPTHAAKLARDGLTEWHQGLLRSLAD